ncbi:MAG: HD family phosphohydrolase [Paludibacteraceae bacterium]
MKLKINNKTANNIFRIGLFIALVLLIVELFPHKNQFKYQYEVGKPWTYELITASFDFPVYKTKTQLEADKKTLLKNYSPYFLVDDNAADIRINKWVSDWKASHNGDIPAYSEYINQKINLIYDKGVISLSDFENLKKENKKEIMLVMPDRTTHSLSVEELYTPKSAYQEIMDDNPYNIDENLLNNYNLNLYLVNNLRYDSITSQNVKEEMMQGLSLTSGMVQAGERIVSKGEIITPEIYEILNSMKIETDKKSSIFEDSYLVLIGEAMIVTILLLLLILYLYLFRPLLFKSNNNLIFISILILIVIGITSLVNQFLELSVYIIPFTLLPIIIRVFFDSRTALFTHIITVLIISFMTDNPFMFIVLQITAGMAAVSGLKDLTQRSQLTQTALYILLTYAFVYLSIELISEGEISEMELMPVVYFSISSFLLLFGYILIYLFEKIFGLISSITLVELTNINSDLMMQFAELAPGTFQHSLQVSNLATEAAKKINANSLLVRTGALYHDIGKMKNPQYFIENQVDESNPLMKMDYEEAAQAIIKHVADGVAMAKKHHLPEQIIAFITTHHGRSKVKYFYNSFVNENPGVKPDEEKYLYPGPIPFSKETAVLMMADAVEARSRTLEEYTVESIANMVDSMIDAQIADGQFKDAPISFRDVETVKKVMSEKIQNIYHNRIKYPDLKK